jgi:hypothetical protein
MTRHAGIAVLLTTFLAACSSSPLPGLSWAEIPGNPSGGDTGAAAPDAATHDPGTGADPSSDSPPPPDPGPIGPDIPTPGDLPVPSDPGPDAVVVPDVPPEVAPDVPVVPDTPVVPDVAPPECLLGEVRSVPCGINGRGTQPQACLEGAWTNKGPCQDFDVCKDGDTRVDACADGEGKVQQVCTAGQWNDSGPCVQQGRWDCKDNVCTPVFGSSDCGDDKCDPWKGESRASCPADCDFGGESGEGKPCKNAWDCAAYAWPEGGVGYWQCSGFWNKTCVAVHSGEYCGTEGQDFCYLDSMYIETPESCPADCPSAYLNCGSDVECIVQPWPVI